MFTKLDSQKENSHQTKNLQPIPRNHTGLPTQLKANVETRSGLSMDDVRIHYNADSPAQFGALAYTQGNQVFLGAGQERHLPHEMWHVVQQKQGRVTPTRQFFGIPCNDNPALEQEASRVGNSLLTAQAPTAPVQAISTQTSRPTQFMKPVLQRTPILSAAWDLLKHPLSLSRYADAFNPTRWSFNPMNVVAQHRNDQEQTTPGTNYHTGQRHGAPYSLGQAAERLNPIAPGRVAAAPHPSNMLDRYTNAYDIPTSATQGRFNSSAWESFSWRKAKEQFAADMAGAMAGTVVNWHPNLAGAPLNIPRNDLSTWKVKQQHNTSLFGSNVGTAISAGGATMSAANFVLVSVNYRDPTRAPVAPPPAGVAAFAPLPPGPVPTVVACNGQMFPMDNPAVPAAGVVKGTDPPGASNGTIVNVPYERFGM